ncbi:16S rRNA (cytidine(1402)-2'-O)-methyltransferase [Maritimibacter sp. HL-12]|jgi:16S rRNA (cytidine1402-2'-O)-methyltransferase|uniref:16S rRNA (cytidine(1402)-2'-O)-methyltransferase n=1 Tax=Maritimibacter sp. HL-12 TaxID=1162418 RepID=UPI000A0F1F10|nr:16S rRNA (cytidine(1402)-2'-O)-methyltransferase [Maritimibacter sp. HL-12]SMH50165.1 16S rRNA (cytidine1402-2'-O)-methyltransferase [Maritimibacter sp. HL-12]
MPDPKPLAPGLYLVATPIGNARDITLRALDILGMADVIAAEDTRTARKLMEIHGIALGGRPLIAYHDHSGARGRAGIAKLLAGGKSVAYVSEAGTPLVSDPGYALAREAAEAGYLVTAAPGASALLAALSLSGLPSDRFLFAGFPPAQHAARMRWIEEFRDVPATLVFYESPRRVHELLDDLRETLGAERPAAICRELTKKFEEVLRGTLGDLAERIAERDLKGEMVVLVDRGTGAVADETMEAALVRAMAEMSLKDAAATVAEAYGIPRRKVYQAALEMEKAR